MVSKKKNKITAFFYLSWVSFHIPCHVQWFVHYSFFYSKLPKVNPLMFLPPPQHNYSLTGFWWTEHICWAHLCSSRGKRISMRLVFCQFNYLLDQLCRSALTATLLETKGFRKTHCASWRALVTETSALHCCDSERHPLSVWGVTVITWKTAKWPKRQSEKYIYFGGMTLLIIRT